jgi:hypothetical protein
MIRSVVALLNTLTFISTINTKSLAREASIQSLP